MHCRPAIFLAALALGSATADAGEAKSRGPAPHRFNSVIATQTFGPAYQFTEKSRLVEAADAIREMGANAIKFELSSRYAERRGNSPSPSPAVHSLAELAREEPSHRRVLDMPFAYYVLWAHVFAHPPEAWRDGLSQEESGKEYREIYDLCVHLLKTYSGTGKSFYLGHWEGDGWLRADISRERDARVTPAAVQGMVDWLTVRQRAVDDARRNTPHHDVFVWHYAEVNHVIIAMQEDRPAMVNRVLPRVPVDYVSYSSYDTQSDPALLSRALDYIESKLPPKPGVPGKRVFIGEYGFPAERHSPAEQDRMARQVMRVALRWGCPFAFYWELYNNEVDEQGRQRGFWMINDHGVKQPVYETHRRFYEWARPFAATAGTPESDAGFRRAAADFLENPK